MKRKYLDDIGVTDRWDTWVQENGLPSPRQLEEQAVYGFDNRETYALDYAFYLWLYERLMMYKEVAAVNLEFHKFEYDGQTFTQLQLIDRMLDDLRFIFREDYNDFDPEQYKRQEEIAQIWALVLPTMWW